MPRKTRAEAMRTKQRLIDSALEIMSEKPYSNVSMTEIAERIGYSKGAIYWHFLNKNALLVQVIENACAPFEKELMYDLQDAASYDTVRIYYKKRMSRPFANEHFQKLQQLLIRSREWPAEVREKVSAIFKKHVNKERELVRQVLAKSQKNRSLRQDISACDLAAMMSVMFHGMFLFALTNLYDEELDFAGYTDFIFDAFYNELKAERPVA